MLSHSLLLRYGAFGAQGIQGSQDLPHHANATPPFGSGDERGEDERETRPLPWEAWDDLRPAPALLKRPLEEVGRPDPLAVLHREEQVGQALLQVLLETLHGRREPLPEPRAQRPPTPEGRPVVRGQEDLLDKGFQLPLGQVGELGQNVPHLVDLAPLSPDPGEDLADGFREAGAAVQNEQEGLGEAAGGQIMQERHPGIGALPGPQAEMEELAVRPAARGWELFQVPGYRFHAVVTTLTMPPRDGLADRQRSGRQREPQLRSRVRQVSNSAWSVAVARLAALLE